MQKPVIAILALAMCLELLATPVHAARYKLSTDVPWADTFPGDGQNLPVGCATTEAQLITFARGLQKVQAAMAEFDRLGYTPQAVRGHVGCARPTLFSKVVFVYSRPNSIAPDSSYGLVPIILVVTMLSETSGEPSTTVTGGLMTFYSDQETVGMATDLVGLEERPFEIVRHGAPPVTSEKQRRPSVTGNFDIVRDDDPLLWQYFECIGRSTFRNFLVGLGIASGGASIFGKAKVALLVAEVGGWEIVATVMVAEAVLECTTTMMWRTR